MIHRIAVNGAHGARAIRSHRRRPRTPRHCSASRAWLLLVLRLTPCLPRQQLGPLLRQVTAPLADGSGCPLRIGADQSQNRRVARAVLRARLWELEQARATGVRDAARRVQVGSGMRGDKRRTVRTQDDQVVDSITGRSWRFKDYERGAW